MGNSTARCCRLQVMYCRLQVIYENAGYNRECRVPYRKGLFRKPGRGKVAAFPLHIPTSRGDRSVSPPGFPESFCSRTFFDLEAPSSICRAPLYPYSTANAPIAPALPGTLVLKNQYGIASHKKSGLLGRPPSKDRDRSCGCCMKNPKALCRAVAPPTPPNPKTRLLEQHWQHQH